MSLPKNFISQIFELAADQFKLVGFQEQKPGIFTLDIDSQTIGWLGLNTAVEHSTNVLRVNPSVGVRHQKLESVVAELIGKKPHQFIPPSIVTNIGYLMPGKKYATWSFYQGDENNASIVKMVAAVEEFGRPFMEQNKNLSLLYNAMLASKRGSPPDPLDYRIPIAARLIGKPAEAKTFLDSRLVEIDGRKDFAAEFFRRFVEKFSKEK